MYIPMKNTSFLFRESKFRQLPSMKLLTGLLISFIVFSLNAQDLSVSEIAFEFLNNLDETKKEKVYYALRDEERYNWHFVPKSRNGVRLGELNELEKQRLFSLLKASLSAQGYKKAAEIIALEDVLRLVENRPPNDDYRNPLNYYATIFGTPDNSKLWGWRFEGHHLAFNFLLDDDAMVSSTPTFFGANPAIVRDGPSKGKQALRQETEKAFALMSMFSPAQLNVAVISKEALPEIISFNSRHATPLLPKGILYTAMTEAQQKVLKDLLKDYVDNYQFGFSKRLMEKIEKAGIQNLSFAWAGSPTPGQPHYYRIQGPMLLIEYDNTQNNGNHVHTTVRDLTNDFGEDLLRAHYQNEH